ncbi:hypothetical protein POM88_020736 [Heracleum sosnowskyi]|uniref:AP180 N-terminal homology (ANTH) domain-containing protein n=1 Tax=Heracleum sosnowskyi TaxID=360622 RepID=A0AAD8ICI9_9APIA|nr:hypothetical protein POM88_020736 [Heracleum sosnowskyi]
MIHGVNYASAGAGLIFTSGSELGQHISFTQQVQQVTDTFQQLILNMGEDVAAHLISNSLFYISIGTNDYIHYYLRNVASESIKIYNAITHGTVNLVDKFFEMNRQDALRALEIYKRPDLNFQLFVDSVLCLCCQIELISRLHHFHVVPLLGFCSENQGKHVERLLVSRKSFSSKIVLRTVKKQSAIPFAERTLTKCREFEETGRSCFREHAFQNIIFLSPTSNMANTPSEVPMANLEVYVTVICKPRVQELNLAADIWNQRMLPVTLLVCSSKVQVLGTNSNI